MKINFSIEFSRKPKAKKSDAEPKPVPAEELRMDFIGEAIMFYSQYLWEEHWREVFQESWPTSEPEHKQRTIH